jgi:hypothetical protein
MRLSTSTSSFAATSAATSAPAATGLVTDASLLGRSNADLDALFRASPSGDIPDGRMRGTVLLWPGTKACAVIARVARLLLWQGKVVDRRRGTLLNLVSPLGIQSVKARVSHAPSWVDGKPCVLIDYSRTSLVARKVRDEIRLVAPGLYLGVVWLTKRRVAWFTLREPS